MQHARQVGKWITLFLKIYAVANREYLAPKIRSMNNRFHSEATLPWPYDYPLANHIATNKSSANREMPLFSRLYPSFGYLRNFFLKYSLLGTDGGQYQLKIKFIKGFNAIA